MAEYSAHFTTRLACDVLKVMSDKENVAFSPLSISACLTMAYAGTNGETSQELENFLHLPTCNDINVHRIFKYVHQHLEKIIHIATNIYCAKDYPFIDNFITTISKYYNVKPKNVDFYDDNVVDVINKWVEDQTAGKIKELIDGEALSIMTKLVLVNALYFQCNWDNKFESNDSMMLPFKLHNNVTIDVPMMQQEEYFNYVENQEFNFRMISIPYEYPDLSMYILLPHDAEDIDSLCQHMTGDRMRDWINNLGYEKVMLSLPRFCMRNKMMLATILKKLGMKLAFNKNKAGFNNMSSISDFEPNLCISKIFHEVFIEVDEKGSEAKAVIDTVDGYINSTLVNIEHTITMAVDHPFIFVIYDKVTDCTLLVGKMYDPLYEYVSHDNIASKNVLQVSHQVTPKFNVLHVPGGSF